MDTTISYRGALLGRFTSVLALLLSALLLTCSCNGAGISRSPSSEGEGKGDVSIDPIFNEELFLQASGAPHVSAASAILIEKESGRVLYQKDADTRRPMASTTKIMTALLCAERGDLDRTVTIPREAVGIEGSSVYLRQGESLTVRELLYAVMLQSANDAATALAIALSGSVEAFVSEMNEKARLLGLDDTAFENPHGLDGEGHYTTARDLAALMAYALENEAFCTVTGTYKKTIPLSSGEGTRVLVNHNRLLRQYDGCIGGKTGYTQRSGRCLVSAAARDGMTLIAVTLRAPNDWSDHTALFDYGFSSYSRVTLDEKTVGYLATVGGEGETLRYRLEGQLSALIPKGKTVQIRWEHRRFYFAPLKEGEILGRAVMLCEGEPIGAVNMIAAHDVLKRKEPFDLREWLSRLLFGG